MQKKLDAAYRRIARNTLPIALENCRPTGRRDRGDNWCVRSEQANRWPNCMLGRW